MTNKILYINARLFLVQNRIWTNLPGVRTVKIINSSSFSLSQLIFIFAVQILGSPVYLEEDYPNRLMNICNEFSMSFRFPFYLKKIMYREVELSGSGLFPRETLIDSLNFPLNWPA